MMQTKDQRKTFLHPMALLAMPIAPIIVGLVMKMPWYSMMVMAVVLAVAVAVKPKVGLSFLGGMIAFIPIMWFGFALWMPAQPYGRVTPVIEWWPWSLSYDQALISFAGSFRLIATAFAFFVPFALVDRDVIGDSLIKQFRVSYRVVDILHFAPRFMARLRQDFHTSLHMMRVRSRGRYIIPAWVYAKATVPVIAASLMHSDELAISLESRGFGSRPMRTIRYARPFRVIDGFALVLVWTTGIAVPFLFDLNWLPQW